MKKILLICAFIIFNLNTNVLAETNCGKFDVACKMKNFIKDTKDFQSKGIEDSKDQLKNTKVPDIKQLKDKLPKLKK